MMSYNKAENSIVSQLHKALPQLVESKPNLETSFRAVDSMQEKVFRNINGVRFLDI